MSLSFRIHNFGCKVNTYDSGLLQARLKTAGMVEQSENPRVHVLNTCAVTKEATREAVKLARRLKARDPLALVVVTGCAAQVDTEEFTHLPGVDLVIANSHKSQLESLIRKYYAGELNERVHKSNIFKKEDLEPGGGVESGHTRSFLKIQDGCNSFCTFCVIPFARGKSRSLTIAEIVARVRQLVASGMREVVFTGVHIGDYDDAGRGLEDLVESVLRGTGVERLRLSSLEPVEVSSKLLNLYADDRMCRHFHMSIQSANSKVLREMKRKYAAEDVERALRAIAGQAPGAFVGMDVIAGFPGESDEEFIDSVERLRLLPWTRLHVFPYSSRPGTFAARREDAVPPATIKRRARILRALSDERLEREAAAQVGRVKKALVLRNGSLLTRDFWPVKVDAQLAANDEVNVIVRSIAAAGLLRADLLTTVSTS
jgi:threonylcarbamoyladenosine tRNA methylthiotransferase MtaB